MAPKFKLPRTLTGAVKDGNFLTKNEIVALLLSCYCVDTVAVLKKEKKSFFVTKLQEEIVSDGTKIPAVAAAGTATVLAVATAAKAATILV
jgi:hypothetical protein